MADSPPIQSTRFPNRQSESRLRGRTALGMRLRPYYWPMRCASFLVPAVIGATLLGPASCGPPAITGDFDSPQPAARIFATRRAAAETDPGKVRAAIPGLIRNLESDDPAVRLLSAEALYELTGETCGYRHYDPEWVRSPSVKRWSEAWLGGELTLRDGTPLLPDTLETNSASERTLLDR